MELTITNTSTKDRIELLFSTALPEDLSRFLETFGFRTHKQQEYLWHAPQHPAYAYYAMALKKALDAREDWQTIALQPSFTPSLEHIDTSKFSYVKLYYRGKTKAEQKDYLIFDSYKKVSLAIAMQFGLKTFGEDLKHIEVFPRTYKAKARVLYKDNQIIAPDVYADSKPTEEQTTEATPKTELQNTNNTAILRGLLDEAIADLERIEAKLEGETETIIATTLIDLEAAREQFRDMPFINYLHKAILLFKDWVMDLDADTQQAACKALNKLTQRLDGSSITDLKVTSGNALSHSKDIFNRDKIIPNVLVPTQAGEPFQSGGLVINDSNFLRFKFPQLYNITDDTLSTASPLALFQLSQMAHPKDYGMQVNRSALLQEWESRGAEAFQALGFPIDLEYPYVNVYLGYKSVYPLAKDIESHNDSYKWWSAVEHSRPMADLNKGIRVIDDLLLERVEEQAHYINPKTKKPKTDKTSKAAYADIGWDINRLERSKLVILNYLLKTTEPENTIPALPKEEKKPTPQAPNDYLDKVIAIMHIAYAKAERLTKTKIERLKAETNAPTLGALWEAVELSWLLWYKMLYNEPLPFEARLQKMIHFWNTVQPTYAYSDSSKELYKQYSTPCPIGAIVAQYTGMDTADFIFEPSAGNGLLLVGANPEITHVNEIDKSRKHALEYQRFANITSENAADPFPERMRKAHDVVVTNPPFARWEASKFEKERIANTYFNKQRGIASHIRLEHLMAGLALHTLTDTGKGAIIIMGHVYFGTDGLFAKYRPFFNWLYRHYIVDTIINMNSYKLYNKQGAVTKTMLILIGGRKARPSGVAPNQSEQPNLETMVESFEALWESVKPHIKPNLKTVIEQLKIAKPL